MNGRSRFFALLRALLGAAVLWCLMWISAMVFSWAAIGIGATSIAFLTWRTMVRIQRRPRDWSGAVTLGIATVAFAVSMFLPLWAHPGLSYGDTLEEMAKWHSHTILEADHIH